MTGERWTEDAACARLTPTAADLMFFGRIGPNTHGNTRQVRRARNICEACPVLLDCLDDVLAVPTFVDRHGIRAGLLPSERADLREGTLSPSEREEAAVTWLGGQPIAQRRRSRAYDPEGPGPAIHRRATDVPLRASSGA